jgi:hypothetical protein
MMATLVAATLGIVACEDEGKAIAPLVDTTPPAVSITNIASTKTTLTTTVRAEDYISVYFIVTEILDDTGGLIIADTTYFAGRNTSATVTTTWVHPYTATTAIQVRGIGVDSQANEGTSTAGHVIVVAP